MKNRKCASNYINRILWSLSIWQLIFCRGNPPVEYRLSDQRTDEQVKNALKGETMKQCAIKTWKQWSKKSRKQMKIERKSWKSWKCWNNIEPEAGQYKSHQMKSIEKNNMNRDVQKQYTSDYEHTGEYDNISRRRPMWNDGTDGKYLWQSMKSETTRTGQ